MLNVPRGIGESALEARGDEIMRRREIGGTVAERGQARLELVVVRTECDAERVVVLIGWNEQAVGLRIQRQRRNARPRHGLVVKNLGKRLDIVGKFVISEREQASALGRRQIVVADGLIVESVRGLIATIVGQALAARAILADNTLARAREAAIHRIDQTRRQRDCAVRCAARSAMPHVACAVPI